MNSYTGSNRSTNKVLKQRVDKILLTKIHFKIKPLKAGIFYLPMPQCSIGRDMLSRGYINKNLLT